MEPTSISEARTTPGATPEREPIPSREARQSIWALAGGKGGVGRSLLAANLGVQLARAGRRVVLIDLDLQGSNLHVFLGYQRLPRTLADFISGRARALSEVACETPTTHLRLIGGMPPGAPRAHPPGFARPPPAPPPPRPAPTPTPCRR